MERGTYINIGTTIILTYFNLDLILIQYIRKIRGKKENRNAEPEQEGEWKHEEREEKRPWEKVEKQENYCLRLK